MQTSILHAACWQFPNPLIKIEFRPTHARHLTSALARNHQQFEERSEWVVLSFAVSPYCANFVIVEHAITLNLARDEGRARRRFRRHFEEKESLETAASDPCVDSIDHRDAIDAALRTIDEPYCTAVVLVDVEGLSYEEAAASAGCALGTMKSRVARGRAAFRDGYTRITDPQRETGS